MKYISFTKFSLSTVLLLFLAVMSGCINDDLPECNTLTLRVVNAKGDDITKLGEVTQGTLFVFDESGKLLERPKLTHDQLVNSAPIILQYASGTKLHLVCWGNLGAEKQELKDVKELNDLIVTLKNSDEEGTASHPDSLFFGIQNITASEQLYSGGNQVITIAPKTATIRIETRGLQNVYDYNSIKSSSDPLRFYMSNTLNSFEPDGSLGGSYVKYHPAGKLDIPSGASTKEWMVQKEENVCEGQKLTFSLFNQTKLLGEVKEGVNVETGETGPFKTEVGKRTYVIIYFGEDGTVSARMKITPWGVVDEDIEWGK